ncbi:unnamed protein product [Vitrella brassicaformis CCMP3155]|uniref:Serine aminopeptidase S33 domain-containing protein n=1 Tax=Vitrella brassicaformis (strain CCMP3155) TaxID=1169540 RepID=A0A0G4EC24_VITBC|nr:unnamed protein product [Vitrella brassicaformis CCMP3155]|mmetsp:Transcript_46225/g.115004  ORF Transcript_46225/g.115004 Transcript_46225/m.115004 type:complete len:265 (-) Transcript_46225:203-997(-)|eukprot:CEL92876.1 unnamed protein product [Vitrella brassicaformis CCMP3155]
MGTNISKLVFQPPEPTYTKDPNLVWLRTQQNEVIPAFFIDNAKPFTLLFSHGNAEDLGMIIGYFREVSQILDVNVFAYEYTGYGMSTGVPNEKGLYADIEAAYTYLTNIIGVSWSQIILYGRSLGSGPSVHLATKYPVRAVVLQSPVLSAYRVAFNFRFTLPGDMFANIDKIGKLRCPVYIIHGTKDEIVPYWHGKDLYKQSRHPVEPFWVDGGGHNNLEIMARGPFYERFMEFLRTLETLPIPAELEAQAAEVLPEHPSAAAC